MATGPRLVIAGKQGSGKGTQCSSLISHYEIQHISTGDIFRAARNADSELGERLRGILDAGELVPDELTCSIVEERLGQGDTMETGFILDGFPRTLFQAEQLSKMLAPNDVDLAINLDIPTEMAVERLSGRRVCKNCSAIYGPATPPKAQGVCDKCEGAVVQRDDDKEEAIRRRLSIYEQETAPIMNYYDQSSKLVAVDGTGSFNEVFERLTSAINKSLGR